MHNTHNNSMTDDKFQQLVQNHPHLFEKAGDIEFSIGDGWFTILDNLCGLISYELESAHRLLKYHLENPDKSTPEDVAKAEKSVAELQEALPTLTQVKEKFGSLRFYYDGGNLKIENYVTFAECMSSHTCEVCGSPGKTRSEGWIKVLCDKHHKEREEKNDPGFYSTRKHSFEPKLSDES